MSLFEIKLSAKSKELKGEKEEGRGGAERGWKGCKNKVKEAANNEEKWLQKVPKSGREPQ